jgi:hypothetical protein
MFQHTGVRKTVLIELQTRNHIKFLRPGMRKLRKRSQQNTVSREGAVGDVLYAPIFAAGRVLVATMLDSILYQTYFNTSILEIFQLLCGIRLETHRQMDNALGIKPSYLTYIDFPADFTGKTFGELYRFLAENHGVIPVGLYRDTGDAFLMNKLPFVFTNPLPGILLKPNDLIYVINPH